MNREERQIQIALFNWAHLREWEYPELELMYHTPNGERRDARTGAILKAMGVKRGVPDVCLPVKRGEFGALYIELKADKGRLSDAQKKYINGLESAGNCVRVCRSWNEAAEIIEKYLKGEIVNAVGI